MADLSVSLAPQKLWQSINPWKFDWSKAQFGIVNIAIGDTPHPEIEEAALDEVGSYGRQLGRIGDVLELLLKHRDGTPLSDEDEETIDVFLGQLAAVRKVKRRFGR